MTRGEAEAWLSGQRSETNVFMSIDGRPESRTQVLAHVAQADAAMMEQAFTTIRYLDYVADREAR